MIELIEDSSQRPRFDRRHLRARCDGCAAGLGEPVFDKLKADLAKALMSLPAVLAFEYGAGFAVAAARGSENNDPVRPPRRIRQGRRPTDQPPRRHAGRHLERLADRLPRRGQAHQQPAAPQNTVTRHRRANQDPDHGPPRPVPAAALRPDGRGDVALVLADHWLRQKTTRV